MNYSGTYFNYNWELLETEEDEKYLLVLIMDDYNSIYITDLYISDEALVNRESYVKGGIQRYLTEIQF